MRLCDLRMRRVDRALLLSFVCFGSFAKVRVSERVFVCSFAKLRLSERAFVCSFAYLRVGSELRLFAALAHRCRRSGADAEQRCTILRGQWVVKYTNLITPYHINIRIRPTEGHRAK